MSSSIYEYKLYNMIIIYYIDITNEQTNGCFNTNNLMDVLIWCTNIIGYIHRFHCHLHYQLSWGGSPLLLLARGDHFCWGRYQTIPSTKIIPGRKIEDKMDAKNLQSFLCSIRCDLPPQQKKVPISYPAWIVMADSSVDSNVFCQSQLFQDRTEFAQN